MSWNTVYTRPSFLYSGTCGSGPPHSLPHSSRVSNRRKPRTDLLALIFPRNNIPRRCNDRPNTIDAAMIPQPNYRVGLLKNDTYLLETWVGRLQRILELGSHSIVSLTLSLMTDMVRSWNYCHYPPLARPGSDCRLRGPQAGRLLDITSALFLMLPSLGSETCRWEVTIS